MDNPRVLRDRSNPFTEYNDEEFRMRFRLLKASVEMILLLIQPGLEHDNSRNNPVSPLNQLLLTLRFYATSSFQIVTGDLFGLDKSTVCRTIHRVSAAIASLSGQFITFPTTHEERAAVMRTFHMIAGFPGVLAALDCTHVAIQSPGGDRAELYRNRKGYFSVNVQATCDAELRVSNLVARWPGSVHDATIFGSSRLCAQFETGQIAQGYMLGDGGYPCKPYLLTPLAVTTTRSERRYNYAQIRTRNPIERTFGVLKRRFPCLKLGLRVKLHRSQVIIVACAVLHNVALKSNDQDPPSDAGLTQGQRVYGEIPAPLPNRLAPTAATAARTALINGHFAR